MSWWQILLLVLGVGGGMALLTYLLTRKRGPVPVDRKALTLAERNRNVLVVKAQREKIETLTRLTAELGHKLEENRALLAKRLEEIDDETRIEFDRLVSDDDTLLERLRETIGTSRRHDSQ